MFPRFARASTLSLRFAFLVPLCKLLSIPTWLENFLHTPQFFRSHLCQFFVHISYEGRESSRIGRHVILESLELGSAETVVGRNKTDRFYLTISITWRFAFCPNSLLILHMAYFPEFCRGRLFFYFRTEVCSSVSLLLRPTFRINSDKKVIRFNFAKQSCRYRCPSAYNLSRKPPVTLHNNKESVSGV